MDDDLRRLRRALDESPGDGALRAAFVAAQRRAGGGELFVACYEAGASIGPSALEGLARSDGPVVLLAEGGVDQVAVARALHGASRRRDGPFASVDGEVLPETLVEVELFGYEKSRCFSPSPGVEVREGVLERTSGGTVHAMAVGPAVVRSLVGLIDRRVLRRIGGRSDLPVGTRLVVGVRPDARVRGVVEGDPWPVALLDRAGDRVLNLAPLRERPDELRRACIDRALAGQAAAPSVLDVLLSAPWPGNDRELRDAVAKLCRRTRGRRIEATDLRHLRQETASIPRG